tara:strand:+ start:394 stop:1347 length:954 start_codon:yes stop_codon:yes gene_type:complete
MEYRKLISFGKSSFVISLPKAWVTKNKLIKGDLLYIEETGPNLILSKEDKIQSEKEKEMVIQVDGKTKEWLAREVCSAYILNYRSIVLKGKTLKGAIRDVQGIIQNLMALEVMEQTTDSIVAKDFLNMNKVSCEELIRKMDVVTRTMMQETINIFEEDNYENINQRDKDVNRLYFLLYRAVLYNLENPTKAMKHFGYTSIDLMRMHSLGFYIEMIADEARRISRYARTLKVTDTQRTKIEKFLKDCEEYYVSTMKACYAKDMKAALTLSDHKVVMDKFIDKIEADVMAVKGLSKVTNRMQRMVSSVHNLGRVVYTLI